MCTRKFELPDLHLTHVSHDVFQVIIGGLLRELSSHQVLSATFDNLGIFSGVRMSTDTAIFRLDKVAVTVLVESHDVGDWGVNGGDMVSARRFG